MKSAIAAFVAAAWILGAQSAQAVPADDTSPSPQAFGRERAALQAAMAESQKDNMDAATLATSLKAIIADPTFVALSDEERHMAYLLYGATLYDARDWAGARAPIKTASEMPQGGAFDWGLRLSNDFGLHDYADAVLVATNLARKWPEKLSDYTDGGIFLLVRQAHQQAASTESDFLEALHDIHWKPTSAFSTADSAWLALVRVRLARGDAAGARAIAMELRDPGSMVALQIDKRFDDIVRSDPSHFDVMTSYQSWLADMKAKSAAAPDKLEGINTVAETLIVMTRYDEALATVSAALDRLKSDPKAFTDAADKRNWAEDIRSRALFNLGRSDEGFAALQAGAAQLEDGMVNVSQAINLSDEYSIFDRPQDALKAISKIDLSNASDYGGMALQDARACAYYALGDTANLNKALDYMKAHRTDGTQPYLNAMLFTGNLDAAAADVIAELQDPARRTDILAFLQDYAPDAHPTAQSARVHKAWIAVRARADVAAEIAKVGHINSYALHLPTY
jgi:hypothetical protein